MKKAKKVAGEAAKAAVIAGGLLSAQPADTAYAGGAARMEFSYQEKVNKELARIAQDYKDIYGIGVSLTIDPIVSLSAVIRIKSESGRSITYEFMPGEDMLSKIRETITPFIIRRMIMREAYDLKSPLKFEVNGTTIEVSESARSTIMAVPGNKVYIDEMTGRLVLTERSGLDLTDGGKNSFVRIYNYYNEVNNPTIYACIDEKGSGESMISSGYIIDLIGGAQRLKQMRRDEFRVKCR